MEKYSAEQMLNYFYKMTFLDILGFGNILGIKEEDNFADYVTNILEAFSLQPRKQRKQLIKLAKEVAGADKDIEKILGTTEEQGS